LIQENTAEPYHHQVLHNFHKTPVKRAQQTGNFNQKQLQMHKSQHINRKHEGDNCLSEANSATKDLKCSNEEEISYIK
jgi:hypothetical protein